MFIIFTNPECKNKKSEKIIQVHHLGYWKNPPDRSNRPSNLITLCDKCHSSPNHKKGKLLHGWSPKVKSFKAETFMSTIYKRIVELLEVEQAFGYETSENRKELNLAKSQTLVRLWRLPLGEDSLTLRYHNDAFVVAGGTTQKRIEPLMFEQIRRHKRSLEQFYDAKYIDLRSGEKVSACAPAETETAN